MQREYGARLVTNRGRLEVAEEERHQRSLLNTFPFNRYDSIEQLGKYLMGKGNQCMMENRCSVKLLLSHML